MGTTNSAHNSVHDFLLTLPCLHTTKRVLAVIGTRTEVQGLKWKAGNELLVLFHFNAFLENLLQSCLERASELTVLCQVLL